MIERPIVGETYDYLPTKGDPILSKVMGFRGLSWVITEGVKDGQRRDVSRKRLQVAA